MIPILGTVGAISSYVIVSAKDNSEEDKDSNKSRVNNGKPPDNHHTIITTTGKGGHQTTHSLNTVPDRNHNPSPVNNHQSNTDNDHSSSQESNTNINNINQDTDQDNSESNENVDSGALDNLYQYVDIFPQVDGNDFYKYIRVVNKKPVITEEFTSYVLNYILSKIQISDGHLEWGFSLSDDKTKLTITIKWVSVSFNSDFVKNYNFTLVHY